MKSKKMSKKFPDDTTLKKVRERLSDPEYPGGNLDLPKNPSEVERAKYQLCQLIAKYRREHDLMQKEIAKQIGIDESRISDILRGKIRDFTLDRLVSYAAKLNPKLKVQIVAA